MSKENVYRLADSTVVEPLVNQWSAWAHLIPPVASSLHLMKYQIEIMKSYLKAPKVHMEICRDPALRSGPFMNVPVERAKEVEELLEATSKGMKENLTLAESLMSFQDFLVREARGQSLEPFYETVPPPLRGYVELVYDYFHRPSLRFFDNLLYQSKYYRPDVQSLRILEQKRDDDRSFIMNTPRLPQAGEINFRVPFNSERVADLFKLTQAPQPLGYIKEVIGAGPEDDAALLPLLSQAPVPPAGKWGAEAVRIRYFGHACVLIEFAGVSVLTDANVSAMPSAGGVGRFTYADLPEKIDYVLITHNHHDHFCLEPLLRLRHRIGCLVVPKASGHFYGDISLKLLAQALGFNNVIELEALESIELPGGQIIPIPFMGEHADLPHGKIAYVIRAGREQILVAADSNCLDQHMYEHVRRAIGPIQTVFLGMECVGAPLSWSCGPFFARKPESAHEQDRRYKGCDADRALAIIEAVGAKRIYVYAMGLEPWLEYLLGLALTEESVQLKEANKLLLKARGKDLVDARLLFGKWETHLRP